MMIEYFLFMVIGVIVVTITHIWYATTQYRDSLEQLIDDYLTELKRRESEKK